MAHLLAVANPKGGCGKTTTAMNLAGGLVKARYRVLVIDADPQASATKWSLAKGQNSLPFEVIAARQLRGQFTQLVRSDEYDIVLVDLPPGFVDPENAAGKVARAAIRECDAVLVPLEPHPANFDAASSFVRYLVEEHQEGQRVLVFINCHRSCTLLGRIAHAQAAILFSPIPGAKVLETSIGYRESIIEVFGSGKTIIDYAAHSEAAREYISLTREIIQCLAATETSASSTSPQPASLSIQTPAPQFLSPASLGLELM
jgi:chromosome partitioning protein